jgi:hypothetical protein
MIVIKTDNKYHYAFFAVRAGKHFKLFWSNSQTGEMKPFNGLRYRSQEDAMRYVKYQWQRLFI